jgi:hypothetical protein
MTVCPVAPSRATIVNQRWLAEAAFAGYFTLSPPPLPTQRVSSVPCPESQRRPCVMEGANTQRLKRPTVTMWARYLVTRCVNLRAQAAAVTQAITSVIVYKLLARTPEVHVDCWGDSSALGLLDVVWKWVSSWFDIPPNHWHPLPLLPSINL